MKILVMTTKSPYPLFEGRALRTYNLLKQAAAHHEIHLVSFVQTREELAGIEHLREFCTHVEHETLYFEGARWSLLRDLLRDLVSRAPLHALKYRTPTMWRRIRELLARNHYDLVHLDMLHLSEYMDLTGPTPVVLVEHNVESVLLQRRAEAERNPLVRAYVRYQARKLARYEARACARARHVVAVSELDAELLRAMAPGARVTSIPNGVDTEFFRARDVAPQPDGLVFVGGLTWFPNLDAIRYFCAEILPLVQAEVPGLRLSVVGKIPGPRAIRDIASLPNVRLLGLIDDVRDVISAAPVYVVPLRVGGGTRLKILDALSMGKAIVSTSVGCEGLDVRDGEQILIADTPADFARAVVRALREPRLAAGLGARGRELVQQRYEWNVIARDLEKVYGQSAPAAGA
jgi:glycosyltransferase involved in cell wall biosynthesis